MIYREFFGFAREPFGVTPDPGFLYLSGTHEEALAHLRYCILEERGFAMLTGEIGSGKTTLVRSIIDRLGDGVHTSVILNPKIEPLEILKMVVRDFGLSSREDGFDALLACLNGYLIHCHERGERAVVFIDEAQDMGVESLEFVRLLSNLETNTRKLLQVVLVGQPELREVMKQERLRQLDQRITVRYHVTPLRPDEVGLYISHRIGRAGSSCLFPPEVVGLISRYSGGLPRLINTACDRILLAAYSEGTPEVNSRVAKAALRELGMSRGRPLLPLIAGIVSVILVLSAGLFLWMGGGRGALRTAPRSDGHAAPGRPGPLSLSRDGIVLASEAEFAREACILNLLRLYGETDIPVSQEAGAWAKKKGYEEMRLGGDWQILARLNMPVVLLSDDGKGRRWLLLLWVVGQDSVVIDPLEGRMIVPLAHLKPSVREFVLFWKKTYNNHDRTAVLQRELVVRGLLEGPADGVFGEKTRRAVARFQHLSKLPVTGAFDGPTVLLLTRDGSIPELYPQEIRKGGYYGTQGTARDDQNRQTGRRGY